MQKFFDKWEFDEIKKIMDYDKVIAKNKCEFYLQKYPMDYFAQVFYANILICFGQIEKAREIMNYALSEAYNSLGFEKNKINSLIRNIKLYNLRILSYENKYDEIFDYLKENTDLVNAYGFDTFIEFLNLHLKKVTVDRRNMISYVNRQAYEYFENDFLYHVDKHMFRENGPKLSPAIFCKGFPFEKVLNEVKNSFDKSKRIFEGFFADRYTFKFDNCGTNRGKNVDYFDVICFHDTNNIITMYPVNSNGSMAIDLSYLNKNENRYTRKLSQIDKFNKRYNIK